MRRPQFVQAIESGCISAPQRVQNMVGLRATTLLGYAGDRLEFREMEHPARARAPLFLLALPGTRPKGATPPTKGTFGGGLLFWGLCQGWHPRYMTFVTVEPVLELHENRAKAESASGERVVYRRAAGICLFLVAGVSLATARDLAVVSNKGNAVRTMALPELVKVCKAQTNRWPDGKPVTFIMRAPASPEMKLFLEKVYALSEAQVKELIVTANHGRANHPAILVVDSDEDLVGKVASIPGALGVVDVYAINSSVAVVKVEGKLPLEPGYLLHGN